METTKRKPTLRNYVVGWTALAAILAVPGYFIWDYTQNGLDEIVYDSSVHSNISNNSYLGEAFPGKGFDLQIDHFEVANQIGSELYREQANDGGVLVSVFYTLKNTSDQPLTIEAQPSLTLVDNSGVAYSSDAGKTVALALDSDFDGKATSDLNPGIIAHSGVVFEVAADKFDPKTWTIKATNSDKVVRLFDRAQAPENPLLVCAPDPLLSSPDGERIADEVRKAVLTSKSKPVSAAQNTIQKKLICSLGSHALIFSEMEIVNGGHPEVGSLIVSYLDPKSGKITNTHEYEGNGFGQPPSWKVARNKNTLKLEISAGYAAQGECSNTTTTYDLADNKVLDEVTSTSCD